jgi:site-specific DNA-methyltransferase (adenine-specific)
MVFEVRDMVSWIYGSGFPKGTDKAKIPEAWQGFNTALKPAWSPSASRASPWPGRSLRTCRRTAAARSTIP